MREDFWQKYYPNGDYYYQCGAIVRGRTHFRSTVTQKAGPEPACYLYPIYSTHSKLSGHVQTVKLVKQSDNQSINQMLQYCIY